jgi:hypothetical protein
MKPFIGKYWGNPYKKLLIIGESHYLPPNGEEVSKRWYDSCIEWEDPEDIAYTNTAAIVDKTDYKSPGNSVYRNIDYAIQETGFKPSGNIFCYLAYMNSFQRLAEETGKSIK